MVRSGRQVVLLVIFWFTILGCSEDDTVNRFSSAQVNQLLTEGDTAVWSLVSLVVNGSEQLSNCQDSLRLVVASNGSDSLDFTYLRPNCTASGSFDSLELGGASLSSEDGVFTDSVAFASGGYWLVSEVFSTSFHFSSGDSILQWRK